MKKILLVSLLVAVLVLTTLTTLVLAATGDVTDPDTLAGSGSRPRGND